MKWWNIYPKLPRILQKMVEKFWTWRYSVSPDEWEDE